jgi:hypothetical protein
MMQHSQVTEGELYSIYDDFSRIAIDEMINVHSPVLAKIVEVSFNAPLLLLLATNVFRLEPHLNLSMVNMQNVEGWKLVRSAFQEQGAFAAPLRSLKVGRNEPCSCGSGKKFKKCHGAHGSTD